MARLIKAWIIITILVWKYDHPFLLRNEFISTLMESNPSSSRTDRKTIERNRRNHMKSLYSKLNSLVPHQTSRVSFFISSLSLSLSLRYRHWMYMHTDYILMRIFVEVAGSHHTAWSTGWSSKLHKEITGKIGENEGEEGQLNGIWKAKHKS